MRLDSDEVIVKKWIEELKPQSPRRKPIPNYKKGIYKTSTKETSYKEYSISSWESKS